MDNSNDKTTEILVLRELFGQMCSSRTKLKPILSEIVKALDNNLFVDADSDEVRDLLSTIVGIQARFSTVAELKVAVADRRLDALENAIRTMDIKNSVHLIKSVLARFNELNCRSSNEDELEVVNKLKRQAHKLLIRADRINPDEFISEGNKFRYVASIIDTQAAPSSTEYAKVHSLFPEDVMLTFALMNRSLSFAPVDDEVPTQSVETPPVIDADTSDQLETLRTAVEKFGIDIDALLVDEAEFTFESAKLKKGLTFKAFSSKLRSFFGGNYADYFHLMRTIFTVRLELVRSPETSAVRDDLQVEAMINEKLYQWGAVDKVYWHSLAFYYLNDYGYELLMKILPSKEGRSTFRRLPKQPVSQLVRWLVFASVCDVFGIEQHFQSEGELPRMWRQMKVEDSVRYAVPLMLVTPDWLEHLNNLLTNIARELEQGSKIRALILVTTLEGIELAPWFKLFGNGGVKNIFAIRIDDGVKNFIDAEGDTLPVEGLIDYLRAEEYDSFSKYKAKALKKKRGRRKKTEPNPESPTEETQTKRRRVTKSTSNSTGTTKRRKKTADSTEGGEDNEVAPLSLFPPAITDRNTSTENTSDKEFDADRLFDLDERSDNDVDEKLEDHIEAQSNGENVDQIDDRADEKIEERSNGDSKDRLDDQIKDQSDEEIEEQSDDRADDKTPTLLNGDLEVYVNIPRGLDRKLTIDLPFVEHIVANAVVRFLQGSAARGMLELKSMQYCNDLAAVSDFVRDSFTFNNFNVSPPDSPVDLDPVGFAVDWVNGLTRLIVAALDDPLDVNTIPNFVPLNYCETFFEYPLPFEALDGEYLRNFFDVTFIIRQSYKLEANSIFELRTLQTKILSDKSNAAIQAAPSIKQLIALFKNFADKTNSSFADSLHADHSAIRTKFEAAKALLETARQRAEAIVRKPVRHPRAQALIRYLYDTNGVLRNLLELKTTGVNDILRFCSAFFAEDKNFDTCKFVEDLFSKKKVGTYLDSIWDNARVDLHKKEKFTGVERVTQINAMIKALEALACYAASSMSMATIKGNYAAPVDEAIKLIDAVIDELTSGLREFGLNLIAPSVLMLYLGNLRAALEEKATPPFYRECLLGTNYIELSSSDLPVTDNMGTSWYSLTIRAYEYELGLEGLSPSELAQAAFDQAVRAYDLGILDRLEQNYSDRLTRPEEERKQIRAAVGNQVDRRLDMLRREFLSRLELDRHYARLGSANDEEYCTVAVNTALEHFGETRNAGLFERFIKALDINIRHSSESFVEQLRARVQSLDESSRIAIGKLIECGRLNVAEDCILDGLSPEHAFDDGLRDFLDSYEAIYNVCIKHKNDPIEKILLGLKRDLHDEPVSEFAEAWQSVTQKAFMIPQLLRCLSFDGAVLEPIRKQPNNQMEFHATFEAPPSDVPFSTFNERLSTDGLDFIYVHYPLTFEQLLYMFQSLDERRCGMVCLLNMALSLADRRKLAHALKLRTEMRDIIIIDHVLALYITSVEPSLRRERLLQAALPFAHVNPFDDARTDLFVGRERELEALRDINGATFLVGGRSIGKTALLERLRRSEHRPSEGYYVIDSDDSDVEKLRADVEDILSTEGVKRVIALLDLNLTFATTDGLEPLERLRAEFAGRFKYIVTAHHGRSTDGSTVRLAPLTLSEASKMTVEPLNYLGLRLSDSSVLRSIWVQSNYNPGLLKYHCSELLNSISDNYERRHFDATNAPPYEFDDELLKAMLNRREVRDEIERRSLRVLLDGRDDYYYVLMLVAAYARNYYEPERRTDIRKLKDMCYLHELDEFAEMNDELFEGLLDEMIDLKLLRRSGDEYEFYRYEYRYRLGDKEQELNLRLNECASRREK